MKLRLVPLVSTNSSDMIVMLTSFLWERGLFYVEMIDNYSKYSIYVQYCMMWSAWRAHVCAACECKDTGYLFIIFWVLKKIMSL